MDAADPNPPGPSELQGQDRPHESGPISAPGPAFAGPMTDDAEEARRFAEAQCCSRWPI